MRDLFVQIAHDLTQVLEGLSVEALPQQPAGVSNSLGWLAWPLPQSHDRHISEGMDQEQLWITEGWYATLRRAPDPTDTGMGHSAAEAPPSEPPTAARCWPLIGPCWSGSAGPCCGRSPKGSWSVKCLAPPSSSRPQGVAGCWAC